MSHQRNALLDWHFIKVVLIVTLREVSHQLKNVDVPIMVAVNFLKKRLSLARLEVEPQTGGAVGRQLQKLWVVQLMLAMAMLSKGMGQKWLFKTWQ